MNKRKNESLFGTDGIRSEFGKFPLDQHSLLRIGHSIAAVMGKIRVLTGRDTRISGPEIERLLRHGLGPGPEVFSAGVIPTPALSHAVADGGFDLGVMITASHNVWSDNGIKLFGPDGEKLPDSFQKKMEDHFFSGLPVDNAGEPGKIAPCSGLRGYTDSLIRSFKGMKREEDLILDCANGAVSDAAPAVFSGLGLRHRVFNHNPDGKNINKGCGSTEPGFMQEKIGKGSLGIMYDGDGDRVLMMDDTGRLLDGDVILYVIARYLKETDPGFSPAVVGTVMSNLALERELERSGIDFFRSDVGDRYVYREMKRRSAVLGGEQSGHVIYRKMGRTGDGILTSLLFLRALEYLNLSPSAAADRLKLFPQVTKSIRIRKKPPLESWNELQGMIRDFNHLYGKHSRILIRYSGTEKKVRLMMESDDEDVLHKNLEIFEDFLISEIGE